MNNKLNVEEFLTEYFTAYHCEVVSKSEKTLTVQLTEEMDLALMNRPFYWQYIKSTGNNGEPMKLSFSFCNQSQDNKAEWIHFGSPRLQSVFTHLQRNAKYTQLFEETEATKNTALHPWLVINLLVKFTGKQTKEKLFSLGLNLINGQLNQNMMESLDNKLFNRRISNYCYVISPLIKINAGYNRIEKYLYRYLQQLDYSWARESSNLLLEEIKMIEHFYEDKTSELFRNEIHDVVNRLEPQITFEVINGGLFYLRA